MTADKILQEFLRIRPQQFGRKQLWEQMSFLDKAIGKWSSLEKMSARQNHLWTSTFWLLVEGFCASLKDHMEIFQRKQFSTKDGRQPPNYGRFLERLHKLDEQRLHTLMMIYPEAFTCVKEEWAQWVQLIV